MFTVAGALMIKSYILFEKDIKISSAPMKGFPKETNSHSWALASRKLTSAIRDP
jgi:hypothetical protein